MSKLYKSVVEHVSGTRLEEDGTLSLELGIAKGSFTRLSMRPSIANEIINCLTALHDEALARQAPEKWGFKAAAYRNVKSVSMSLSEDRKHILIVFDESAPHRVGVAFHLTSAPAFVELMQKTIGNK